MKDANLYDNLNARDNRIDERIKRLNKLGEKGRRRSIRAAIGRIHARQLITGEALRRTRIEAADDQLTLAAAIEIAKRARFS